MSFHYLDHGPLPSGDPALGPIDNLCGLLKLGGVVRIQTEVGGGFTGARVFVAENQVKPGDPAPFSFVFKVAKGAVLRQEVERYENLRRFFRARNAFAAIVEPGLMAMSLQDDYDAAIAYEHVAAPFARRDSIPLKDLVAAALRDATQIPAALDVLRTTMRALASMYTQRESEFAFQIERYYADRWLPHLRVTIDEVVDTTSPWLLTRRRLNPSQFVSEANTPPDVVRRASEAAHCELQDVVLPMLKMSRPVRGAFRVQESNLSIEIDVSAVPAATRQKLAAQDRVSIWAPPDAEERRYAQYSRRLHRAFPGEDLTRAAVALGGHWFHNPLNHLSQPLIERTRSCPATSSAPAHGDLHPGNVLVVGSAPVIIDYGLSEVRLPVGVDAARLFGGLVRDVYSLAFPLEDLTAILRAVVLDDEEVLRYAPSQLADTAALLRSVQSEALGWLGEHGGELWALHLYGFAFIGLKWDSEPPFTEHAACCLLAAVALTRLLGEPSPDELLVTRPAVPVQAFATHDVAPEGPAEILILVSRFHGSADYDPTARIFQALADNLFDVLPDIARVEYIDRAVLSRKDAIVVGSRYQASMMVWGSYDNLGIRPRYEVTRDSMVAKLSMIQLDEATRHELKEKFDVYVTENLANEITFLSLKAVGAMCVLNLNHSAALSVYQKALTLVPRPERLRELAGAEIHRDIASILFGRQRFEEALEANVRAADLAPDDLLIRIQGLAIRSMVEKRPIMKMVADLRALVQERAEAAETAEEREAFDTALITLEGITSPAALQKLAEKARRQPRYVESQNRQYAKDVTVHLQRGSEHIVRRELQRALHEFDLAIRLNPLCAYAIAERGHVLASLDRVPEALAQLDRAARIDPDELMVHVCRAAIWYERGDYEKSLENVAKARRSPFGKNLTLREWGLSFLALGKGEEMMAELKTEDLPLDNPELYEIRSGYFRSKGQYDAALREVDEGLQIKPDSINLLTERATIHAGRNDFELALEDAHEAATLAARGSFSRHRAEKFLNELQAAAELRRLTAPSA